MGITASSARPAVEVTTDNEVVPPANSEAYFLMFGGPPITGTQFLDHNVFYVQSQRVICASFTNNKTQQQPQAPPEFKETITIQNDINCLKRTIKLTPQEEQRYLLQFEFDTRVPCDIYVYILANEFKDKKYNRIMYVIAIILTFSGKQVLNRQSFGSGSGQTYSDSFHLNYHAHELVYDDTDPFKYPLVIELRSEEEKYQYTYCSFAQTNNGIEIKPLKQKITVQGQTYELADIYGFDNKEEEEAPEEDADDSKCVVCITDQADTAVIPCRHMCMCYGCAKILRLQTNKCPICRTQIDNLIVVASTETEVPIEEAQERVHDEIIEKKKEETEPLV
jgi:hypothetical protein